MPSVSDYVYTVIGYKDGREVNRKQYYLLTVAHRKIHAMKQTGVYDEVKMTKRYRGIDDDKGHR